MNVGYRSKKLPRISASNPDTIYKWIERKKMPAHKVGRLWKFLASEIDEWIKGGHAAKDFPTTAKGAASKRKLPRP
jgi:excisionase family DNA binding protein